MRIREVSVPAAGAEDTDAFVANTDTTADTPLTLEAAAASIDPPRELLFTFDGDSTAVTLTVVGTNRRGAAITETVVGLNADTYLTKNVYASITSITPNATDAGTMEVGFAQRAPSPWFLMNTTHAHDALPGGSAEVLQPANDDPAAGEIEFTLQNAARLVGENAQVCESPVALTNVPGDHVEIPPCAWWRVVNTAATGTTKVAVARPSF